MEPVEKLFNIYFLRLVYIQKFEAKSPHKLLKGKENEKKTKQNKRFKCDI